MNKPQQMAKSQTFIGTSGFSYLHWVGKFYSEDLLQSKWLEFYIQNFNTVELNNTFYRLPDEKVFKSWYERSPKNFIFAVKVNRYITGIKRLKDIDSSLTLFLKRVEILKEKLGPLLFQFPPNFKINLSRLENLLKLLPKSFLYSFEFRHPSWYDEKIYQILEKNNVSFCIADWPIDIIPKVTSNFLYIRRHGANSKTGPYGGDYTKSQLKNDAEYIKKNNKDTYVYFNNDANAYAVKNAKELIQFLKVKGVWP